MADTCRGCVYYRSLSESCPNMKHYCNYLLDTGNTRDCPAENCKKKISMEEYMKRLTQEQKQEIIRLRVEDNVPAKVIAEKFHLSKSAVFNIISKWKEHGESAISEDEIRNELHDRTISEAADDDYVCYEVTGDTDIEAYMSDGNVKEPDTAATVTGSEQKKCVEVPADIIPEKVENVKPDDDLLPCAVVGAIADQIDRLYDRLAETTREIQQLNVRRTHAENEIIELKMFLTKNGYSDVVKTLTSDAQCKQLKEMTNNG